MEDLTQLAGRQWLASQADSHTFKDCKQIVAIAAGICNRCGSKVKAKLPSGKYYCQACIGIGRVVEGDYLIRNVQEELFSPVKNGGLTWQGKLTEQQEKISTALVKNFHNRKNTLVHAVTGAGKTEMLFQLIAECMRQGQRACIATPRIDVVNELFPRFQAAFQEIAIGKYHGREFREPGLEQLTICTTHQLMKFYQAFDLLVIDEVDSFPYVGNAQLHFAAKYAVKKSGMRAYLTATPTADLLAEAKAGKLEILKLKRRFHGGLLPVPKEKLFFRQFLKKERINPHLLKEVKKVIQAGHPLLLFVPRVEEIPAYLKALAQDAELKQLKVKGVHAADPQRIEKVQEFRERKLDILVTTTILERGVTFKNVWVIIVAADDAIYTTASLVQIAGRVGRAKDDPDGLVLYCYHRYTQNIRDAILQIKEMNR
ncbi:MULTISPECIES: DEAD/DEAH box helicase [Lactobacillus]|uniref:DEAD/DEAH box helicase n=1 Tax=Lactobacillus xujianguonis TaxID=2495899 RepID=A0A437STR1_9LACO|nr:MULTISPECIES: helicase-related protein [Lactobacillus]RVU70285.1 DEAD/DEAH box helicase [Lactobacillus xujianguonis]RVU73323.1 DEAD/DEAH box helicase [Lactobacillus xujianguonis]